MTASGLIADVRPPEGWTLRPLRYLATLNPETLPETHPADAELDYIDIGAVGRGELVELPETMVFADAPSRARRVVRDGDILVSTVRTYLRAVLQVAGAGDRTVASTGFAALRPGPEVDGRFLYYWCLSDPFVETVVAKSKGVSYPAINASELLHLPVALPSLEVQRRVANMLDAETARIDSLVAKNQRALDLVRLRREATIGKLTSGGLDAGDPLEAFAEQPTIAPGWRVTKLKYVAERVTVGIVVRPAELYVDDPDDGVPCLRGVNIRRGEVTQDDLRYIGHQGNAANLKSKLLQGDVVVVRTGEAGVAAVVPDWAVGGNCVDLLLVRPGPRMDAKFVELVLNSDFVRRQVARGSVGSIQSHFNVASLSEAVLAVPEVSEQRRIVEEVRERVDPLDTLTRRVNNQIELLGTRRQALITAAVTGQITI